LLQRGLQLAARGIPELDAQRDRHLSLAQLLFTDPTIGANLAAAAPAEVAA
jgi:hypothetical protein